MTDESDLATQREFLLAAAAALIERANQLQPTPVPEPARASASPTLTNAYPELAEGTGTAYDATVQVTMGGLAIAPPNIDPTLVQRTLRTLKGPAVAFAKGLAGRAGAYTWDEITELIRIITAHR